MKQREYTQEEVQEMFLDKVRTMIDYWNNVEKETTKDKLEGLAHSILATIDGSAADLPAFKLAPNPHPGDKEYCIDEGENYFPDNYHLVTNCNISGSLHEQLFK